MKLYIAAGVYVGTQAEAKKLDRDFTPVEVPTDKEGLIAYLNEVASAKAVAEYSAPPSDDDISDLLGDDEPAVEEILSAKVVTTAPVIDTYTIVDWLLDTATPTQVEVIFGALGARFHEANKDKNND